MKKRKRRKSKRRPHKRQAWQAELLAIVDRTKVAPLGQEEYDKLKAALQTLEFLREELESEGTSIAHLRQQLFGPSAPSTQPTPGGTSEDEEAGEDPRAKRFRELLWRGR